MKQLLFTMILIIIMATGFSQIKFNVGSTDVKEVITLKSDTLFVPAGTCKYIKIGDKVYKMIVKIEEVQEQLKLFNIIKCDTIVPFNRGIFTPYTSPLYLPKQQSPAIFNLNQ